jgi:hypothetical protein
VSWFVRSLSNGKILLNISSSSQPTEAIFRHLNLFVTWKKLFFVSTTVDSKLGTSAQTLNDNTRGRELCSKAELVESGQGPDVLIFKLFSTKTLAFFTQKSYVNNAKV